jgi:hypothetical protein
MTSAVSEPESLSPVTPSSGSLSSTTGSPGSDRVRLVVGETPVADYIYLPEDIRRQSPRPYFDGLRTRGGHLVTRMITPGTGG